MDSNSSTRRLVLPCRICFSVLYLSLPCLTFSACSSSFFVALDERRSTARSAFSISSCACKRLFFSASVNLSSSGLGKSAFSSNSAVYSVCDSSFSSSFSSCCALISAGTTAKFVCFSVQFSITIRKMANVRVITNDTQFSPELTNAGTKLVIADYFATWCGPCRQIAPKFSEFSTAYPKALFLKIDVDQCPDTAQSQGVTAMPTFIFYRNKVKIDMLRGADPAALEEKIKKWYQDDNEDGDGDMPVKGHMDLLTFINKSECECLNESDEHTFIHALSSKGGYLESDCDEQLIINVGFSQAVKIHSLRLEAPADKGPKTVKIFINQPRTLDFDQADSMAPVQQLDLTVEDLKEGNVIPLKFVKFQNVQSITLFVRDNQSGAETTQVDYVGFLGSPVNTTNMGDFKRVAGKKGESH